MDAFQPAQVLYPDAELVCCQAAKAMGIADYVGRTVPANPTTAIVFNRVGGRDPDALMQVRCYAPTDQEATDLARELAARLPAIVYDYPVIHVYQNTGITDLGPDPGPMRQMLYEVTLRGSRV